MSRLRDINRPGVRRVRALHELLELVDRWSCLEGRSMEGAVFSTNKCETLSCPAQCHGSPFCPACLAKIKTALKASELDAARALLNEDAWKRALRKKGKYL